MKFKGSASALLRTRIASGVENTELRRRNDQASDVGANTWMSQVCWLIYLLSTVELSARNYREAAIHSRMILNFLYSDDPSTRVVLRLDVLNAISFWDVQRASITLSRPSFDPDRWAADYLLISWESLVALQATPGTDTTSTTESCEDATTQAFPKWPFTTIQETRNIARILVLLPTGSDLDAARLHFSVWNSIHEARLLNHLLDTPNDANCLTSPTAVYLACLYWLRRLLSSESTGPLKTAAQAVPGTTLYDAGPAILRKLNAIDDREREAFGTSSQLPSDLRQSLSRQVTSNSRSKKGIAKLRLWVIYVAAMVERATPFLGRPKKFAIDFLKQAHAMDYFSWSHARDRALKMFLYDEELDPAGDAWYETVLFVPLREVRFS